MSDRARLRAEMLHDLGNLIVAIDRRLPRLLHADELAIAKDAAELRAKATAMMVQLEALPIEPNDSAPDSASPQLPTRSDNSD